MIDPSRTADTCRPPASGFQLLAPVLGLRRALGFRMLPAKRGTRAFSHPFRFRQHTGIVANDRTIQAVPSGPSTSWLAPNMSLLRTGIGPPSCGPYFITSAASIGPSTAAARWGHGVPTVVTLSFFRCFISIAKRWITRLNPVRSVLHLHCSERILLKKPVVTSASLHFELSGLRGKRRRALDAS